MVKLGYRLAKRDGDIAQVLYYGQGVGTGNLVDRLSGGAFGEGLEGNIHDAYRFLVANYEPGDELYLFGFSRGAFTARSLAGMIRKCGILERAAVRHYRDAIALYRNEEHPDEARPQRFRKECSITSGGEIPIHMIGVWDTVGALGIPLRGLRSLTRREHQFHDTELSGTVQRACHALAIDERRAPFEPTLWSYKPKPGQQVEQVWFCGAHSDVGGGYAETALSDIALEWMIGRARAAGLAFHAGAIAAYPLRPDPLGPLHNPKTGLYRFTAGIERAVGDDPTQSLHESVLARWQGLMDYRPASLAGRNLAGK